ncbi:putative inactive leucine-rich repeat receptor protein kinase [Trifolium repens]|nr:putative inactive leucine-rich repeat receptor protein kinase [Trifolium repens]
MNPIGVVEWKLFMLMPHFCVDDCRFTTFVVEWSLMGFFSPPYGLIKLQLCKPIRSVCWIVLLCAPCFIQKKEEDPKGNKWARILKGTKKVKLFPASSVWRFTLHEGVKVITCWSFHTLSFHLEEISQILPADE